MKAIEREQQQAQMLAQQKRIKVLEMQERRRKNNPVNIILN